MAWNFVPEIVAVSILAILLVFHHKTIYVRTHRDVLFVRCIWTAIIAACINTLSVLAILRAADMPLVINIIINDLYFLVTPFIVVTFMHYWLYIIYEDKQSDTLYRCARGYMYIYAAANVAMAIANHFWPLLYYFDDALQYVRGPAALVPHLLVYSAFAVGCICLLNERGNVQKSIRAVLMAVPAVMAGFMVLQQLIPDTQLQGSTLMMGVLLLYLSFHSNNIAYDKLTDCFNRDSFYLALRRNYPYMPPNAFIMVAVGNYSVIRNEYGQQMIDELVWSVATYLRQVYGQKHTFRIGEDMFVCAVADHTGMRGIEQTHARLNADWLISGVLCRVDCNVAVYEVSASEQLSPEILSYLNYAIAKAVDEDSQGSIFCTYELRAEYEAEKRAAAILKEAIRSGEFSLYFEPVCRISSEGISIIGADCGIGFPFESNHSLSHEQVFAVADRYNLLSPINELVLQRACAFQRRLTELGHGDILLFCEITQTQLRSQSLITRVQNIVREARANPQRIKLQLGGQPVPLGVRARGNLERLQQNNIGVCLKDSGRSGMDDLLTTCFSYVKLDEAALFAMGLSSRLNAFFRLVRAFFAQFDTTVIARNVISEEHVRYLESHGIEYAQGPGVMPPMLEEDFIVRLNAQKLQQDNKQTPVQ